MTEIEKSIADYREINSKLLNDLAAAKSKCEELEKELALCRNNFYKHTDLENAVHNLTAEKEMLQKKNNDLSIELKAKEEVKQQLFNKIDELNAVWGEQEGKFKRTITEQNLRIEALSGAICNLAKYISSYINVLKK